MCKKIALFMIVCLLLFSGIAGVFAEGNTPSGISFSGLEAFVDEYAAGVVGKKAAGASILVVKDNQVILSKGYGYADVENQIPVEAENTVFEWGSISKLLVWVAVMQQVEQGTIDLETDVQAYLPEGFFTKLTYEAPITMLNLMHHNAGFEENILDLLYKSPDRVRSLEEGLRVAEPAQIYEPGKVVAYSNYSTALAGYIVERVTGQPFYAYVDEHIFKRVGMNSTSIQPIYADNPALFSNKAKGYNLQGEGAFSLSSWSYMSLYPCGAANGTVEDLAAFAMALMPLPEEQTPLFQKRETLDKMLSQSYTPNENMLDIAHGFWEYPGEKRGLTHGGNTIAFSSNFHLVPEERFAVIVLTNQGGEIDLCYGLPKALVERGGAITPMEGTGLGAKLLEGKYLMARRPEHSVAKLYPYFIPLKVEAIGENRIQVSQMTETAEYIQTAPNVYRKASGSSMFDPIPQLYFQVENGSVIQISSVVSDYLPLPAGRTTPFLILYIVAAALCGLYFITMLLIHLIQWIRSLVRKEKNRISFQNGRMYFGLLNFIGISLVGNCLLLSARMVMDNNRSYDEIKIHFFINLIFTVLAFITMLFLVVKRNTYNSSKGNRRQTILSMVMLGILIALLVIWNFYS